MFPAQYSAPARSTAAGTLALFIPLLVLFAECPTQGAALRITPAELIKNQRVPLSLELSEFPAGDSVWFQRYADLEGNGVLDPADIFLDQFQVTDGLAAEIGGNSNPYIPGDDDGLADGHIQSYVFVNSHPSDQLASAYLFRAVSASNAFSSVIQGYSLAAPVLAQTIHGSVFNRQAPLPLAWVYAYEPFQGGRLLSTTQADANGNYRLDLPSGDYQLAASTTGFVFLLTTHPIVNLATNITVDRNLELTAASLTFSGRIQDASTSSGIAAGLIRLESDNGLVSMGFVNPDGTFSLPVLPGRWRLAFEEPALVRSGYLIPLDTEFYEVNDTGLSGVVISIPKADALIMGRTVDNLNRNVAELQVVARKQGQSYRAVGASDPLGQFVMSVNEGTWEVGPDLRSLASRGLIAHAPVALTITNGAVENISIDLLRPQTRIQGQTVTLDNGPVGHILLASSGPSSLIAPSRSGPAGQFTVPVVDGSWIMTLDPEFAAANNYVNYRLSFSITNGTGPSNLVYYIAPLQAQVRGVVLDPNGAPLVGQPVQVQHSSGMTITETTDQQGLYDLGLSGGRWRLTLPSLPTPGSLGPTLSLDISPGTNLDDVNLQVKQSNRRIAGQVLDADSNGIPSLTVQATFRLDGTNYLAQAKTDEMGLFLINAFEGMWEIGLLPEELSSLGWTPPAPQTVDLSAGSPVVQIVVQPLEETEPAQLSLPLRLPNNQIQFSITGTPNVTYTVQGSSDMLQWNDLTTFQSTEEPYLFKDEQVSTFQQRFYRVIAQP